MKRLVWLLSLYLCLPLMGQENDPIREAMAGYDYETALRLIANETPATPVLYQKALALKALNRYSESLEVFRQIVHEEPENIRIMLDMAECCKQAGSFSEGLKCYEQAIALSPGNKYAQLQYISTLCFIERYPEARNSCQALLEADRSIPALQLMAQAQAGLMNPDSALLCYNEIIEREPYDYNSVSKAARLYIDMNQPESAVAVTEKYRENDSTNLHVNRLNAQAYCLANDYPTAIERYESLVEQGDKSFSTCYYLGMSYYVTEDYYGAHDFLMLAHLYEPGKANLLYYLGRACVKTSWKKEGLDYLHQALELVIPTDSVMTAMYGGLVEGYQLNQMYKEQIEAYAELYKYNKERHSTLYDIAWVYFYQLKDEKSAERYLERFLKTKPKESLYSQAMSDEDAAAKINNTRRYKAAERMLDEIRREKFFREGAPEKSSE